MQELKNYLRDQFMLVTVSKQWKRCNRETLQGPVLDFMIPNLFIYTKFNFKFCIFLLIQDKSLETSLFKMFLKEVSNLSSLDLAYLIKKNTIVKYYYNLK